MKMLAKSLYQPHDAIVNNTMLRKEIENLKKDSYVLRQKLKQKGLSEVGYAFWYYVLNAIVASIFVVGINEISSKAIHPTVTKAILWMIFIMAFLPLLTTSIAYYSQYFVASNHIVDDHYPEIYGKKYFSQLDNEKFFPLFQENIIKNNSSIKNLKTSLKNWLTYARKPEILCIRAKSWAASLVIIGVFSFIQYVCYRGIKSFFIDMPQKESIVINVILNIVISIALTIMFIMIKHVLDRIIWGDHATDVKKNMLNEYFCQPEPIIQDSKKNIERPSDLIDKCTVTNSVNLIEDSINIIDQ